MKKYLLLVFLFASCKTYTGVRVNNCGGLEQYSTYKKIQQPIYERYGDMWLVRWKGNSSLVFDTTGQLEKLKRPVPVWALVWCK